jgi:hypothetical protein
MDACLPLREILALASIHAQRGKMNLSSSYPWIIYELCCMLSPLGGERAGAPKFRPEVELGEA